MQVAVTGGAGQLGTLVLQRLLKSPDVERVVCLDLVPPRIPHPRLQYIQADVRDPDYKRHLEGIDTVVHLAFLIMVKVVPKVFEAINIQGSKNVFEAAVAAGVTGIVYTSSIAAYGVMDGHPEPITEDTERKWQPDFPYSAAKFQVEAYLDEFEPKHPEMTVTRFRPSILIGKHMPHMLGIMMARGYVVDVGDTLPPLVWDEDVADAIVLAVSKRIGGAFNLGAAQPLPFSELARIAGFRYIKAPMWALELCGACSGWIGKLGILPSTDPSWFRFAGVKMVSTAQKAYEELGWEPSCPTAREVIERYVRERTGKTDRRFLRWIRLLKLNRLVSVPEGLQAEMSRMNLKIHLEVEGPGGGDFKLHTLNGRMLASVERPRAPDSVASVSAATMLDLLSGKQNVMSAQMLGRLRIAGEPSAAFVLNGTILNMRRVADSGGVSGRAVRRLLDSCAEGAG